MDSPSTLKSQVHTVRLAHLSHRQLFKLTPMGESPSPGHRCILCNQAAGLGKLPLACWECSHLAHFACLEPSATRDGSYGCPWCQNTNQTQALPQILCACGHVSSFGSVGDNLQLGAFQCVACKVTFSTVKPVEKESPTGHPLSSESSSLSSDDEVEPPAESRHAAKRQGGGYVAAAQVPFVATRAAAASKGGRPVAARAAAWQPVHLERDRDGWREGGGGSAVDESPSGSGREFYRSAGRANHSHRLGSRDSEPQLQRTGSECSTSSPTGNHYAWVYSPGSSPDLTPHSDTSGGSGTLRAPGSRPLGARHVRTGSGESIPSPYADLSPEDALDLFSAYGTAPPSPLSIGSNGHHHHYHHHHHPTGSERQSFPGPSSLRSRAGAAGPNGASASPAATSKHYQRRSAEQSGSAGGAGSDALKRKPPLAASHRAPPESYAAGRGSQHANNEAASFGYVAAAQDPPPRAVVPHRSPYEDAYLAAPQHEAAHGRSAALHAAKATSVKAGGGEQRAARRRVASPKSALQVSPSLQAVPASAPALASPHAQSDGVAQGEAGRQRAGRLLARGRAMSPLQIPEYTSSALRVRPASIVPTSAPLYSGSGPSSWGATAQSPRGYSSPGADTDTAPGDNGDEGGEVAPFRSPQAQHPALRALHLSSPSLIASSMPVMQSPSVATHAIAVADGSYSWSKQHHPGRAAQGRHQHGSPRQMHPQHSSLSSSSSSSISISSSSLSFAAAAFPSVASSDKRESGNKDLRALFKTFDRILERHLVPSSEAATGGGGSNMEAASLLSPLRSPLFEAAGAGQWITVVKNGQKAMGATDSP